MSPRQRCTEVSDLCPVSATVLGYYPNLGSNYFFTIVFGITLIGCLVLGIRGRTWTYMVGMTLGLVLETAGYVGRILLHKNPWDQGAFQLEICAIILGPTFICISVYLTLKHVALHLNPALSRVAPRLYPLIFLPADITCLVIQGIGGGLASGNGDNNVSRQQSGNRMILAGVALQVVVLIAFGIASVDYYLRVRKYMRSPEAQGTDGLRLWNDPKFRTFGYAVSGAFFALLIRCVYRIAEMAGGWGNKIMQDEPSFLVLDSSLVAIAAALLTFVHPTIFFPQMRTAKKAAKAAKKDKKAEDVENSATLREETKEEHSSSSDGHKVDA